MIRVIYEVYAKVVDSSGAYNTLDGYPKVFDSKFYNNDAEKTLRRASGEFADTYGAFCKRDDRQMQTVILMSASGQVLDVKSLGKIAELPDQEA